MLFGLSCWVLGRASCVVGRWSHTALSCPIPHLSFVDSSRCDRLRHCARLPVFLHTCASCSIFCCDDCAQSPTESQLRGRELQDAVFRFSPLLIVVLQVFLAFLSMKICESSMPISRWMWHLACPSCLWMSHSSHGRSSWSSMGRVLASTTC